MARGWGTLGVVALLAFGQLAWAGQAPVYLTTGRGTVETCHGLGIEMCSSEEVTLPRTIDVREQFREIWYENKRDYTMCYERLPGGLFTKKTLMFRCVPRQ